MNDIDSAKASVEMQQEYRKAIGQSGIAIAIIIFVVFLIKGLAWLAVAYLGANLLF